jgi:hypothetical protein
MQLLDCGLDMRSTSIGTNSEPNLRFLVVGHLCYEQKRELQHNGEHRAMAGIHHPWAVWDRPVLFKIGYTKVCSSRTYTMVQEDLSSLCSKQERFPARVIGSVWSYLISISVRKVQHNRAQSLLIG